MQKWEYQIVKMETLSLQEQGKTLETLGAHGWELVTVTAIIGIPEKPATLCFYLKRPADLKRNG